MEANFVYFLVPMATLFDSDGIIHHNFNDDHQCIIFTHTHTQNDFFKMILIGFFILALSPYSSQGWLISRTVRYIFKTRYP